MAYGVAQLTIQLVYMCRAPQLMEARLAAAAPLVLGAFGEKHSRAHGAMWDMVLGFLRTHPSAWDAVDAKKAILPRFNAFLRWVLTLDLVLPRIVLRSSGVCSLVLNCLPYIVLAPLVLPLLFCPVLFCPLLFVHASSGDVGANKSCLTSLQCVAHGCASLSYSLGCSMELINDIRLAVSYWMHACMEGFRHSFVPIPCVACFSVPLSHAWVEDSRVDRALLRFLGQE
jgi:hypothetical protein